MNNFWLIVSLEIMAVSFFLTIEEILKVGHNGQGLRRQQTGQYRIII